MKSLTLVYIQRDPLQSAASKLHILSPTCLQPLCRQSPGGSETQAGGIAASQLWLTAARSSDFWALSTPQNNFLSLISLRNHLEKLYQVCCSFVLKCWSQLFWFLLFPSHRGLQLCWVLWETHFTGWSLYEWPFSSECTQEHQGSESQLAWPGSQKYSVDFWAKHILWSSSLPGVPSRWVSCSWICKNSELLRFLDDP